ncbi:hypothetical protein PsYK624_143450 [Phanerochaete sordida]|uniref:Uncharacterized protein n=1 Tax=Phanerochaete sordida TaxID=48140 RepID=A0A9P3GNE7_9APHY|nr:hypothetical protein PsYK624_143450 [Phanerochaete sordida]
MDVTMRSPSFRTHRSGKQKRARSPPSPSPYERPAKRQSMAAAVTAAPFPQTVLPPPAMQDRQVSEDWVTRTRTLSIGKEHADHEMRLAPLLEMVASASQDETMNMDNDVTMQFSQSPSRSPPALPPIPSMPAYPSFSSLSSHQLSTSVVPSSSSSAFSHPMSSSPSPHTSHDTPFSSPNIPPQVHAPSQYSIMHSPQIQVPSAPAPTRKQRFTMGPRADCEKCRLGVPGHWVHYD